MEQNSNNKRKTFPGDNKSNNKDNKQHGDETENLFKNLDKDPDLFTQILTQEAQQEKKPTKKKRKLREISSNTEETDEDESLELNKKPKSGKTKRPSNLELEDKEKKTKETKRSLTKEKIEKISKPKSKERNPPQKKFTDKEATSIIQSYMIIQNRPFSAQNIIDNHASQIKKPQCQKILDALLEQGFLIMKEYNVKIYLANQNQFKKADQKDLNEMESNIEKSKTNVSELQEKNNELQAERKAFNEILSNEELDKRLREKKKLLDELENKFKNINLNKYIEIADDKIKDADKIYADNKISYKKTKKICLGVIDYLGENMEKSRKELIVKYFKRYILLRKLLD